MGRDLRNRHKYCLFLAKTEKQTLQLRTPASSKYKFNIDIEVSDNEPESAE